jgi:hypothetical protein
MDERQDLVGIVHKAIHTFSAEKAGDLEFDTGDHITVFQVNIEIQEVYEENILF